MRSRVRIDFFMAVTMAVLVFASLSTAVVAGNSQRRASSAQRTAASGQRTAAEMLKQADAFLAAGRAADAVAVLRKVTQTAPTLARGWYALGQAYNAIKQEALATFDARPDDEAWRRLVAADALLAKGHFTDAFVLYRGALEQLPSMVSIHDSVARIYDRTGHGSWATRERALGALSSAECAGRAALCAFRTRQYQSALAATVNRDDAQSRYWRARAAAELALAAFKHLDQLADSPERRVVRATVARTEERYTDAVAELTAATKLAPGNQTLVFELGSAYYAARDYDQTIATISPLLEGNPEDPRLLKLVGYSLLQLRRADEALPVLKRAVERDATDPGAQLALGKAYLLIGDFKSAIPLIEAQLSADDDGSLHVQLARAYSGLGESGKAAALLARSQEIQRESEQRSAAAARRAITAPK
jgi:predicted Zn-dependent protease